MIDFIGTVKLNKNSKNGINIEFDLPKDKEEDLVWDDVEDALLKAVERDISIEVAENAEILEINIVKDRNKYPVISESQSKDKKLIDRLSKDADKILILPEYKYSITPEYKLWLKLFEQGIVNEDDKFDFNKMTELLTVMNGDK